MNLSQDEINAMLTGTGETSDAQGAESELDSVGLEGESSSSEDAGVQEPSMGEELLMMMQENEPQLDAADAAAAVEPDIELDFPSVFEEEINNPTAPGVAPEKALTAQEVDVLGEVGNICMGAVATTMYTLLDRRVDITTPRVSVHTTQEVLAAYQSPFVVVQVEYVEGIAGKNLLLLKEYDAALITDLLMGGDGTVEEPVELNELHLSAISEVMNQMIGASATALSKLIGMPVNISTPVSRHVGFNYDVNDMLDYSEVVIKISFDMEIEGLLKSELLQLLPIGLGREMASTLSGAVTAATSALKEPERAAPVAPAAPVPSAPPAPPAPPVAPAPPVSQPEPYAYPPQPAQPPTPGHLVDVRPMQYPSFDEGQPQPTAQKGMDLIYDIPLQVSVELGKTKKDISEILEFGMGTVVVLDKMAGEPVEILANGKLIARGEVVVIDENYGVRITEILSHGQ